MSTLSAAFGVAFCLIQVSYGGISSLNYDLARSENGDYCVVEECLYLGDDDTCWETLLNDSNSMPLIESICDSFNFITCDFDELVFSEDAYDNYCDEDEYCPGCPCDDEGSVDYYERDIGGLYKQCYKCECIDFNSNYNTSELAWNCNDDNSYSVYWYEDDYETFECPYNENSNCSYNGDTYEYGELFMVYDDSYDESLGCQTACYCHYDGTITCETGAQDIVDNEDLYEYFLDQCDYSINLCADDPDSWVFYTYTSNCEWSCPRCSCDANDSSSIADYYEYTSTNTFIDIEWNGCATDCECREGSYSYTGDYIDCDDNYESVTEINCPPELTCSDIYISSYSSNVYQYSEACNSVTQTYCSNTIQTDFGFYDGDVYTGQDDWSGCQDSFLCEIAGITGNDCVYYDVSFTATVTDCDEDGDDETYEEEVEFTDYLSCCQGDYCNNDTVVNDTVFDTSVCTESSDLGNLWSGVYTCQTSASVTSGIGDLIYCDADDWYETMSVCEYLEAYVNYLVGCYCEAMGAVYDNVSSTAQTSMDDFMSNYVSEINLIVDAYECELSFSCDLEDNVLSITYTEYTVSFDLTLTNYNSSNFDKAEVTEYIADVIGVSTGFITLSSIDKDSDQVSMMVTVTFETEEEASTFSSSLSNGDYEFGDDATVEDVGTPTVVQNVVAASKGWKQVNCGVNVMVVGVLVCLVNYIGW